MTESTRRRSAILSPALLVLGLLLTLGQFSRYRPFGNGPINAVFLLGPVVLAGAAASCFARPGRATKLGQERATAGCVAGLGLVMLLAGGYPWLYTPLFMGGESGQGSGMLGFFIFLYVGLPGLAVAAVGLISLASQRRAREAQEPAPDVGGPEE